MPHPKEKAGHGLFQRFHNSNIFYSTDIDIGLWREINSFSIPNAEKKTQRLLKRVFLMDTYNPYDGGNHLCDVPTVIASGDRFLKNDREVFKILKVHKQKQIDPKSSDGLVLRTTIFPDSSDGKSVALNDNLFGTKDAIVIKDSRGLNHFFHLDEERKEFTGEELVQYLDQLSKSAIIISSEEPKRQRQAIQISSSDNRIELGFGYINSREMQMTAANSKRISIGGVEVIISSPYPIRSGTVSGDLKLIVNQFLAVQEKLMETFNHSKISLDARVYSDGPEKGKIQFLDFNLENHNQTKHYVPLTKDLSHDYNDKYFLDPDQYIK